MSSMNMSIGKLNIASGLAVEKIGVNNLDLYIPRINEKHNELDVKIIFANYGIGLVEYVDFVATKDPETKEIKYYSAFLKLTEWNPDGYWHKKIIVEKQNKIQISPCEFWLILLAKTTISRSKVNTHQLASYTDELFVRIDAVEKKTNDNITVSSEHLKNLLAKSESQAAQIEQLMKIVQIQSEQLTRINNVLFDNEAEETSSPRVLTIEDLYQDVEEEQFKCQNCSMEFDTKKQLCFHESVCKTESPTTSYYVLDSEILPSKGYTWEDDYDDCFLSKHPVSLKNFTETVDTKRDIIQGSFSINLDDILGPLAKSLGLTKEEAEKQLEKEISNSKRAISSRNYCGNE